jgi:SAM-dependent methyltransferase
MLQSIRSVLAIPAAYQLWWNIVGGPAWAKVLINEYVRPMTGSRILEIGCGPGNVVPYLPDSEYLGFDLSSQYIRMAKRKYPNVQFVCERVSRFTVGEHKSFDAVLALGIVHHLDDAEANHLFQISYDALKPGGKLVTIDGVWLNDQSRAARWLLARDRGNYIRNQPAYLELASKVFSHVKPSVRHDLLRIPYTHLILECVRGTA